MKLSRMSNACRSTFNNNPVVNSQVYIGDRHTSIASANINLSLYHTVYFSSDARITLKQLLLTIEETFPICIFSAFSDGRQYKTKSGY